MNHIIKAHTYVVYQDEVIGCMTAYVTTVMQHVYQPAFENLKIRASYGTLGNQQVGYYDYIRTISISNLSYLFGNQSAVSKQATISNPTAGNLTWETAEQKNLGIDAAWLNNRLTFTGEFYIRDTKDMLTAGYALPEAYGASSPKMNTADMRTKGYELSLGWIVYIPY